MVPALDQWWAAYFAAVYAMLNDEPPTFSRKKFRGTDDPRLKGK
jgi:hypothetical protein